MMAAGGSGMSALHGPNWTGPGGAAHGGAQMTFEARERMERMARVLAKECAKKV